MDKYNIVNEDQLKTEVRKKFIPYVKNMMDTQEDNLVSVLIYGSSAGKNYVPKISDINSVFVVKELDFSVLKRSQKIVSGGISKKITAPLFLTERYIKSSLDVFPIEFLDMKENHVLVCGKDILADLEINGEHIRLFCEQQIKGKLIRIRQAYLEVGHKRKGMEALLKESLNSMIPVFRNLIRLKGKQPPVEKTDIIRQFCQMFELEENVFLSIYKDSTNDEKIEDQDVIVFMEKYLSQIEHLTGMVDEL